MYSPSSVDQQAVSNVLCGEEFKNNEPNLAWEFGRVFHSFASAKIPLVFFELCFQEKIHVTIP